MLGRGVGTSGLRGNVSQPRHAIRHSPVAGENHQPAPSTPGSPSRLLLALLKSKKEVEPMSADASSSRK